MRQFVGDFAMVVALSPSPALAERNLVPSMGSVSDTCPDRPEEPQLMQEIGVRDAYQRVLVQDIYRAQSLERIVDASDCSCETRFPPWDAAETEFFEHFTSTERWEMLEASDAFGREANALRPRALAICEAEGVVTYFVETKCLMPRRSFARPAIHALRSIFRGALVRWHWISAR